ncbi:MAG: hypothetical protein GY796_35600 [Chloroflexi bacterium]|nr:hypothetical protein [Chloroflexota bacterium]
MQELTRQATPTGIQELVAALGDKNATIVWTAGASLRQSGGGIAGFYGTNGGYGR